jgi:hypothetical protein
MKLTKLEKEKLEAQGIKVTIGKFRKAKGSGGQKFSLIKTKFHQKSSRPHKHSAPSTKVISGIYGNNQQFDGKEQHRGFNPLAAQKNKAIENY